MTKVCLFAAGLAAMLVLTTGAKAEEIYETNYYKRTIGGSFEDAMLDLESAILNEGLVIDYRGHVGDMLKRTGPTVGKKSPYSAAEYMVFCAAKHTHGAVAASPENIAICPWSVFAYELAIEPGTIHVGYRRPLANAHPSSLYSLGEIDALLLKIVSSAGE